MTEHGGLGRSKPRTRSRTDTLGSIVALDGHERCSPHDVDALPERRTMRERRGGHEERLSGVGAAALARALRRAAGAIAVAALAAALACGHGASSTTGARDVRLTSGQTGAGGRVPQAELLEDLQRFTGQFMDHVTQAGNEVVESAPTDATSDAALRTSLLLMASALDIASEPLPELAVLDMVVFLRLARSTLADHWLPKVYGDRWRPLLVALEEAEQRFWPIATKIMSEPQKADLVSRIDAFRRANPNLVRVEAVRLTDFSAHAGAVAVARELDVAGALAAVKAATQTGDQAVMLAERGVFLLNRLPFLLRLQVRLGSREIVGDTLAKVGSSGALAASLGTIDPLLEQLPPLVAAGRDAARETRMLAADVAPLIPTREEMDRLQHTIGTLNELVVNSSTMVREVRSTTTGPGSPVERAASRFDATVSRLFAYLVALGAAWSALWWGGYVLARRASRPGPEDRGGGGEGPRDVARGTT